jgi:hypothetical protein
MIRQAAGRAVGQRIRGAADSDGAGWLLYGPPEGRKLARDGWIQEDETVLSRN